MKKNKMMRIASVLLVAVLLSTCAISSTFAKYTTEFTGTTSAKVATWSVNVADADVNNKTFNFNIMDTIVDVETGDDDGTDDDVASQRIAPGTKGSFSVVVTNNSEVNATYVVELSDAAADLPFEFSISNGTGNLAMGATATVTVNWEWPFDGNDDADLLLAGTDLTIAVNATVTQAN